MAQDRRYLEWQAALFQAFMKRPVIEGEAFDPRTKKTYRHVHFVTRRSQVFGEWYERWYPGGQKRLPQTAVFTPLALAVWFADDGCVGPSCSPWRMKLKLSTHGFPWEDVRRLASALSAHLGASFHVQSSEGFAIIVGADTATRALLKVIDPVLPPGMERKAYWRLPEARFYAHQPPSSPVWGRYQLHDHDESDDA